MSKYSLSPREEILSIYHLHILWRNSRGLWCYVNNVKQKGIVNVFVINSAQERLLYKLQNINFEIDIFAVKKFVSKTHLVYFAFELAKYCTSCFRKLHELYDICQFSFPFVMKFWNLISISFSNARFMLIFAIVFPEAASNSAAKGKKWFISWIFNKCLDLLPFQSIFGVQSSIVE